MASTRELWGESYIEVPPFPCPHCDRGVLRQHKDALSVLETKHSRDAISAGHIVMEDGIYRYTQLLECAACGEIVASLGAAELTQDPNPAVLAYTFRLSPKGFFPAPPLVTLVPGIPDAVRQELEVAFGLFWTDLGACANKMRVSVEKALDELGIPAGKSLFHRIDQFKAVDPEHAESFDALRFVGNVGSHEGGNSRESILDAFEVYQDAIRNIFGGHRNRIDQLRKNIIAAKGR